MEKNTSKYGFPKDWLILIKSVNIPVKKPWSKFSSGSCAKNIYGDVPGWTKHANHTNHHKIPDKKQPMVMPSVFCFFFCSHSVESVSVINLYGRLMNLMVHFMVIRCFSSFYVTPVERTRKFCVLHRCIQAKFLIKHRKTRPKLNNWKFSKFDGSECKKYYY